MRSASVADSSREGVLAIRGTSHQFSHAHDASHPCEVSKECEGEGLLGAHAKVEAAASDKCNEFSGEHKRMPIWNAMSILNSSMWPYSRQF